MNRSITPTASPSVLGEDFVTGGSDQWDDRWGARGSKHVRKAPTLDEIERGSREQDEE
jgi:hypothetical protein